MARVIGGPAPPADVTDTPYPLVDLDAVDRNIARLQGHCDRLGLALRPHIKTHKSVRIAHRQLAAGAVGITCQKLGEAEVMAAGGVRDIMLSYCIVGESKLRRLGALARSVRLSVWCDSLDSVERVGRAARDAGAEIDALVDCDTGFARTGVATPADAAAVAAAADAEDGLRFRGLATYPTPSDGGGWLGHAVAAVRARGLDCRVVSGGGTPHAFHADAHAGLTEMRAGTYLLGDRTCVADDSVARSDCALRIVATVVARPARDRVIVDAGSKALSSDPVEVPGVPGFGEIDGSPDAALYALSEEHGHVRVPAASRLRVGERIAILPNHCCGAMNMHDTFLATSTALEAPEPWPVDARGCVR